MEVGGSLDICLNLGKRMDYVVHTYDFYWHKIWSSHAKMYCELFHSYIYE